MKLDRRTFLQRAGLTGLAWGIAQGGLAFLERRGQISSWFDRHYRVLAAPTPRKLALLVGVNEYVDSPDLKGCLTDVELQRELLVHRFGFDPADILTLTGNQATREGIETAFLEHLSEQAKAGDVVVFHFSGYGNRVKIPRNSESGEPAYSLVNSFMPSDGVLPTKGIPAKNDLLEETLGLLARSLATDKLTTVLDTSYTNGEKVLQGNLRIRSFPSISARPNPEELAVRAQLRQRLKAIGKLTGGQPAKVGITLAATPDDGVATEISLNGFSAGLFTYALTQYLWQVTSPSKAIVTLSRTAQQIVPIVGPDRQPAPIAQSSQPLFTYYLMPEAPMGAEGVITEVEDPKTAYIKLVGLPLRVLQHYGLNSCFTLVPPGNTENQAPAIVQIRDREGLKARVKLLAPLKDEDTLLREGQFVREFVRIIPRHIGLTVALDSQLERIERVDATSAFASIAAVSSVVTAGEQGADCLLARVPEKISQKEINGDPAAPPKEGLGGYQLFLEGGTPVPNTAGVASEAVKSAIERLTPQWNTLLAAKLWQLTLNEGSSALKVSATLERVGNPPQALMRRETRGQSLAASSARSDNLSPSQSDWLPQLPLGSQIQYRLENHGEKPIYFLPIGLDAGGKAIALLCPPSRPKDIPDNPEKVASHPAVSPGETLTIPAAADPFNWMVSGLTGLTSIQIVCSQAPLSKTWQLLESSAELPPNKTSLLLLSDPLSVAQALLEDLERASAVPSKLTGGATDIYSLDVNAWATLNFVYRAIEKT